MMPATVIRPLTTNAVFMYGAVAPIPKPLIG
jgi:hypothetical protein